MAWKRGNPGCPCCRELSPPTCNCPGGGISRSFIGTPTVIITIEDVQDVYTFDCFYTYAGVTRWETITLSGLAALNGTYAKTFPDKTPEGCIDYFNSFYTFTVTPPSVSVTRRVISGSTGCTISSSTTPVEGTQTSMVITQSGGTFTAAFSSYNSIPQGATSISTYSIRGTQRLICSNDFNPALDANEIEPYLQTIPGLSGGMARPLAKEQKLWIIHAGSSSSRCTPFYTPAYVEIGKFKAEIIDDV